jgi:hypothetical protein
MTPLRRTMAALIRLRKVGLGHSGGGGDGKSSPVGWRVGGKPGVYMLETATFNAHRRAVISKEGFSVTVCPWLGAFCVGGYYA